MARRPAHSILRPGLFCPANFVMTCSASSLGGAKSVSSDHGQIVMARQAYVGLTLEGGGWKNALSAASASTQSAPRRGRAYTFGKIERKKDYWLALQRC